MNKDKIYNNASNLDPNQNLYNTMPSLNNAPLSYTWLPLSKHARLPLSFWTFVTRYQALLRFLRNSQVPSLNI